MTRYKVVKKETKATVNVDTKRDDVYSVTPKNKVRVKGTIKVTKMKITDELLARAVILRKIDNKLKEYVYIITEEESSSSDGMNEVLNDLSYYRSIIKNKYAKYLKDKELDELYRKLDLIEHELKLRKELYLDNEKEMGGKSR